MSEFGSGQVKVTTNAAVKAFEVGPGDTRAVLRVLSNGVYIGHDSGVTAANGYWLNGGETLELPLSVPDGETAAVWVRGATTQQSILAFFICQAA